ncbi:hypothetical protein CAEBREN_25343 [Caenorhabditis brenneri]|uniref:Sdz-33 F-box domain-containing protein n=1 Tax=Caenorhabditis brenneri TaxID=135651 RepID=G0N0F5_CAEBE|nr:hypothetical protein CAEBREN_25343 [Caenorhabditis brenneri]
MSKRARLTAPPAAMMEEENPQFPLFRLPQKEILRTIRVMPINLIIPTKLDWNNNFELKDWLQHILTVFNRKDVDTLHLTSESTQFNLDDLKENFGRPSLLIVEETPNQEYNQLMLQTFLPVDRLNISLQVFENSRIPPEILTKNFLNLQILNLEYGLKLTLDVLLTAKAKTLYLRELHCDELDFNKFIKRWMRHGAYPELEYLCITFPGCGRKSDLKVMRGLWHVQMPFNEIRLFKTEGYDAPIQVRGGNDIRRKGDGMKATIEVDDITLFNRWHMYVWKEHCVVENDEL